MGLKIKKTSTIFANDLKVQYCTDELGPVCCVQVLGDQITAYTMIGNGSNKNRLPRYNNYC